jgi:hypothetical protein
MKVNEMGGASSTHGRDEKYVQNLVGRLERKNPLRRHRHRWDNNRDSSVGIALGYGLDDRGSGFRFSAGTGNFSLHNRVQNGSGAHPASNPYRGLFL